MQATTRDKAGACVSASVDWLPASSGPDPASVGDSGVFTTVLDLAKWNANFYDNTLEGGPELIQLVTTRGVLNDGSAQRYAFGLGHSEVLGRPVFAQRVARALF